MCIPYVLHRWNDMGKNSKPDRIRGKSGLS